MDSMHDLGGKQGFGAIPIGDDHGFHHDWERRMWALGRSGALPSGTTIDWFRHGLECMVPLDYLSFAYFNKWCVNYFMLHLDSDTFTMEEALAGHVVSPLPSPEPVTVDQALTKNQSMAADFSTEIDAVPRFQVGDMITTKRITINGHTRLPAYARGASGTIIQYHGAHMLPDKGAKGVREGEHLYTVSFNASDLWGPDTNPRDTVTLELWENYFV